MGDHGSVRAWTSLPLLAVTFACAAPSATRPAKDIVTIVTPRCQGAEICVLGHVTAIGSAAPVAEASVFLERELAPGEDEPVVLIGLTDAQGVFTFEEPPPGNYHLAIYKEDSGVELSGLTLGEPGITVLPVRLAR